MSDLLGSQDSDYFPEEVKHILRDPDVQDVINSVQTQDPYHVNHMEQHFGACVKQQLPITEFVSLEQLQLPSPESTPSPTCRMLCTEEYPGPYDFEIQLNGEQSGKGWQFSYPLNKLFINLDTSVHLSFKCSMYQPGLFVRAIAVYTENDSFCEPVIRCFHHRSATLKQNMGISEHLLLHIVKIEDEGAEYCYDESSKRRSVRVPVRSPQPGTDWVNVAFKFMCKNSCMSGMNRRPIEVVFTLEDINAFVYGRQKMKVRICSCPKRDKHKEENDSVEKSTPPAKRQMKRTEPAGRPTKLKKVAEEMGENFPFQIPVLHQGDYLDGVDYMIHRLKRRLRIQKREPTEEEADLLQKYESILSAFE